MSQETLPHQEDEFAQQSGEAAARFDTEPLPERERQVHVHLGEHGQSQGHSIEMKEGHACGADCPDHAGASHHHEHSHHREDDHTHTIARKSAAHACGADCPDHGIAHSHEEPHAHVYENQPHGHRIKIKEDHVCGVDCPEHSDHDHEHEASAHGHDEQGNHHSHPESQPHHEHHIEHKPHACGADCPEHGAHNHDHAGAGQKELNYDGALAYQKAEEAIRRSQGAETQALTVEPGVAEHDVAIHEHIPLKAELVKAPSEAEPAGQHELQIPEQQPEREEFIAKPSIDSEASIVAMAQLEAVAESPSEVDVVGIVGIQPKAETLHDDTDPGIDLAADMQLPEVEVATPAEVFAIPSIERVQYSDARELSDAASPTMYSEIFDGTDAASIETVEPLESTGIARVEPPMFESTEIEQLPEVHEPTEEAGLLGAPELVFVAAPNQLKIELGSPDSDRAAESLAELVSQRIEAAAEHMPIDAPLRAQAIQKTLRTLTELQTVPDNERNAGASHEQLLRLLQLLGYENPAHTLRAYTRQYGFGIVSELQAKLLELLSQGRVYESLSSSSPSSNTTSPTNDMSTLGMLALTLARLRGHLLAVASGA